MRPVCRSLWGELNFSSKFLHVGCSDHACCLSENTYLVMGITYQCHFAHEYTIDQEIFVVNKFSSAPYGDEN